MFLYLSCDASAVNNHQQILTGIPTTISVNPGYGNRIIEKITIPIQHGDTLLSTLRHTQLSLNDSNIVIKELSKFMNVNQCMPGDFFEIIFDKKTKEWLSFSYHFSKVDYYYISKSLGENKTIKIEKKNVEKKLLRCEKQGIINYSLWKSMSIQNIPNNVISTFINIFSLSLDFKSGVRNGDKFKIIYDTEVANNSNTVLSSKIIAASYITSRKIYNALYFKSKNNENIEGYFNELGKSLQSMFLQAPLKYSRISSYFSEERLHPILKYVRPHLGIDYVAPIGTPVFSVANGTVTLAEIRGGFGNLIVIKHLNGYETYYGHLSGFRNGIKKGCNVSQGQVIGYVGMTGLATGPHLDFRIKYNGKFINFLEIKNQRRLELTNEYKKEFIETTRDYFL
ncbi:MAG: M23 family metallopeptidase [Endomicrobium sp.]|nr:M23 family metallopeptidase [Endomicrobium sp.]